MAGNEIDAVSVRLTASAVDLLKETDAAVNKVESVMEDLGESIDETISDALRLAGEAVVEFAEQFGTTIEEAAEQVGNIGKFNEIFGFDTQQLTEVARAIKSKMVEPMADATSGLGDFNRAAGAAAGSAEGIAAPIADTADVLEALGIDAPAAIKGGIEEPLDRAKGEVEGFGAQAEQTFGQEVPQSIDKTDKEVAELGSTVEGLTPKMKELLEVVSQTGGEKLADSLTLLNREMRNWQQMTGATVKEVVTNFTDGFDTMGLSVEKLTMLAEGNADALRTELGTAVEDAIETAQTLNLSFEASVDRLEKQNRLYGLSGDAVKTFATEQNILTDQMLQGSMIIKQMQQDLAALPPIFSQQYLPAIASMNEEIEKNNTLSQSQIALFKSLGSKLSQAREFWEILEPAIAKVNQRLVELGGIPLDPLQTQKIIKGAEAYATAAGSVDEASDSIKRYVATQGEAVAKTQGLSDSGSILGDVIQMVGGRFGNFAVELASVATKGAAALVILKALWEVGKMLKAAAEDAIEFNRVVAQSVVTLALQANATGEARMQSGYYVETLTAMAERVGVAREELISATNQLILMNQQTGLAGDQVLGLAEHGAAMASIFDKNVGSVLQNLMQFITTGMRSGLDDFGLQLDQIALAIQAENMGLGDNLDALTESQMAMVRYGAVMEQTNQFVGAAEALQGTLGERMDASTEIIKTQTVVLGNIFAPLLVAIKELWAKVVYGFVQGVGLITTVFLILEGIFVGVQAGIYAIGEAIGEAIQNKTIPTLKDLGKAFKDAFQEKGIERARSNVKMIVGAMDELEQKTEDLIGTTKDLGDAFGDITDEMANAFADAATAFDDGMAKIQQRYEDAMDDIERRFGQRRADAETDRQRDLAKIDQEAALDRLDAIEEYQVEEIRLREDHEKDIRQLEERYLLDLEDAVRERDARGVLSLQRRFNLEKKKREEDYLLRNKRLKEDLLIELREIEKQRLLKRQQRWLAFQEEMLDLAEQERRRQEEAALRRDRAERDLIDSIKRRLDALMTGAEKELEIEYKKLEALYDALIAAYGPNGWYEKLYDRSVDIALAAASAISGISLAPQYETYDVQAIQSLGGGTSRDVGTSLYDVQGIQSLRQRGGSIFATSPTTFTAGEGRPERVDVTPLSESTGQPSAGFRGGGQDRMEIVLDVNASELLTVEVADQTMSEIADVIVSINQRSQGGRGIG